ncbi:uncharacterized protein DS421_5g156210 [Arachis hypogaea]|nr:uncharacterized protein DS421_5g156210 [Arachis hypogaea]
MRKKPPTLNVSLTSRLPHSNTQTQHKAELPSSPLPSSLAPVLLPSPESIWVENKGKKRFLGVFCLGMHACVLRYWLGFDREEMGDDLLTILFHHGGSFITDDGGVTYNGGDVFELPGLDPDKLDVFFVRDYHKDLGYDKVTQTWWLVPNRAFQNGLRALTNDKELMEMCYLGQQNKGVVHVYYEHGVSEPLYIEEAEAVSSKGKEEVLVIQDLNPTPNTTTNDNAEPIPTTATSTTTSAPIHRKQLSSSNHSTCYHPTSNHSTHNSSSGSSYARCITGDRNKTF